MNSSRLATMNTVRAVRAFSSAKGRNVVVVDGVR